MNAEKELLELLKELREIQVNLIKLLQAYCKHENTINVGDADHNAVACQDCGKVLA